MYHVHMSRNLKARHSIEDSHNGGRTLVVPAQQHAARLYESELLDPHLALVSLLGKELGEPLTKPTQP